MRCALIGQLSSALWLAEYLKRVTEMLRAIPCCDAVSRDETNTMKPTINEAFVAFCEDIITDYNDSYSLFTGYTTPPKHNTTSAFVKLQTSTTLHSSKLTFESSVANSLNIETYLQAVSQKHQTVLAKLELPHFIVFTAIHSVHIVGYTFTGSGNSPP